MEDYTISEFYELPSEGKIYDTGVNPKLHFRSMTTNEEMMRLSQSDYPYKTMCEIIDRCLVEPVGISSYEMSLGDYQYCLHKLRTVTYGNKYSLVSICPVCGKAMKKVINLDEIEVFKYFPEYEEYFNVELPTKKNKVKLRYQTPRDMDEIEHEVKQWLDNFYKQYPKSKPTVNIKYLFQLKHLIETVDGQIYNSEKLEAFLRALPMLDTNKLLQAGTKINTKVGINTVLQNKCDNPDCGAAFATSFRITDRFFGPVDDE